MATQNIKFAGEAAINALAAEINKKLTKVSSMPESPDLNMTVLYVGATTSSYTQGGIYQWDGTQWNLLSGGGSGASVWGNITGTLSDQTDLQDALNNIDYIIGTMGAKNILQIPSTSKTENGVTWTIDSGRIGVSGTPTDYSSIALPTIYDIDNKKYILTGIKDTENILWGKITLRNKNFSILHEWTNITDDVFELDLTSYTNVGSLTIVAGTAENNVAVSGYIYPMVCHSEFIDDTTYARYAKTNVELTNELQHKQDSLTFDEQPRLNSNNPVTSNGIKTAINENNNTISNSFETELKDTVGWIVKNQLDILLDEIKTLNVNGTWDGNTYTHNGITFTFAETNGYVSGITASGVSTSSIILYLSNRPATYYRTWSGKILSGVKNISSTNSLYRQRLYKQFTNPPYASQFYDDVIVKNLSSLSDSDVIYHSLNIDNNVDLTTPVTFNLMLRDPSIISNSFIPYSKKSVDEIKFDRAEQAVLGAKNALYIPNQTKTLNDVTAVVNDGIISFSGTNSSSSATWLDLTCKIKKGTYKFSGLDVSQNVNNIIQILTSVGGTNIAQISIGTPEVTFTLNDDFEGIIYCRIAENGNANNIKAKLMLRLASDPDDTYVPYAMTNKELTDAVQHGGSGHTMKPDPSIATEANVVSNVNGAISSNDEVASLFGIQRWSNVKTIRLMITSGIGHNGIGEWQWVFPTIPTKAQETEEWGWFYHESIKKLGDLTKLGYDYELAFKFDSSSHEVVTYGGHQVDTDTGCICIRFANYVIDPSFVKIAVDINIVRNDIAV